MHEQTLSAILALSFFLGLVHAFDADHIVAVSSLASRKRGWKSGIFYAFKWALGHGGILLLAAIAALYFRWQLPESISYSAEKFVGIILIVSGLSIFWSLYQQQVQLKVHRHGDVVHAHLATADKPNKHDHTPVLVGIVHGLAGSAPALALIPATLYRPSLGLAYVLIFSLGVLAGMVTFGMLLSHSQRFLLRRSPTLFNGSRALLGVGATALGVLWLSAA
jgi:ABC-type nickel/cobalt efflux system permease component RcnA